MLQTACHTAEMWLTATPPKLVLDTPPQLEEVEYYFNMSHLPENTFRLVKEKEGPSYLYKEVPVPAPVGDELLVKVGKVALCGTDISLYQWNSGERSSGRISYSLSMFVLYLRLCFHPYCIWQLYYIVYTEV